MSRYFLTSNPVAILNNNTEDDFLRRGKETLLINILKPTLNDK